VRRAAAEQRLTEPGRAMGHGKRATAQRQDGGGWIERGGVVDKKE